MKALYPVLEPSENKSSGDAATAKCGNYIEGLESPSQYGIWYRAWRRTLPKERVPCSPAANIYTLAEVGVEKPGQDSLLGEDCKTWVTR